MTAAGGCFLCRAPLCGSRRSRKRNHCPEQAGIFISTTRI